MKHIDFQEEDLASLRTAVNQQPVLKPSNRVRAHLMTRTVANKPGIPSHFSALVTRWVAGVGTAILVFVILWQVVNPGVELSWSVNIGLPVIYRVYRSTDLNNDPMLVHEFRAESNDKNFHLVDDLIPPALNYTYIVEGVAPDGQTVDSRSLSVDTSNILLTQAAILVVSLLLGWEIIMAFSIIKLPFFNNTPKII